MSVNTEERGSSPELRRTIVGSRVNDVAIAIMAAHHAGAFAANVSTTQRCDYHGRIIGGTLLVHLEMPGDAAELGSADQAFAVLRKFGLGPDEILSQQLTDDGSWVHQGTTGDGVEITIFAGGPSGGPS